MSVTTTSILHRTPWTPPIAIRGEGIYVDLEDGRRVIDGVGGAAVSCIGTSHPKVIAAVKEQLDTLPCPSLLILPPIRLTPAWHLTDVYNMQLSSKPAEELAEFLVDSSNGAFELVIFASGGKYNFELSTM